MVEVDVAVPWPLVVGLLAFVLLKECLLGVGGPHWCLCLFVVEEYHSCDPLGFLVLVLVQHWGLFDFGLWGCLVGCAARVEFGVFLRFL